MKKNRLTQLALIALLKKAPLLLLIAMVISFFLSATVQVFYYKGLFGDRFGTEAFGITMAIAIGLLTQFIRVALGVSGAYEFERERFAAGVFGLACSLGVTIWESFEFGQIIATWADGNTAMIYPLKLVLIFILWIGFILEVRLAVAIGYNAALEEKEDNPKRQKSPPSPGFSTAGQDSYQEYDEHMENLAWLLDNGNQEDIDNFFSQNGNGKKGKVFQ